jgi:hypothetical protein
MTVLKILVGLINAILRAATSSFLVLISTLITSVAVLALAGFAAFSLTGVVTVHLSRRRAARRNF